MPLHQVTNAAIHDESGRRRPGRSIDSCRKRPNASGSTKKQQQAADDVQLGRQAAAQAEQQFPVLRDDGLTSYVTDVGRRLAGAILQHPEFQYSFKVVNVKETNAFALAGGPMYVNRGMIEAAQTEGEVAGVMAHELSHVALRHRTAQASKATKYQMGLRYIRNTRSVK